MAHTSTPETTMRVFVVALSLCLAPHLLSAQLRRPDSWRIRTDRPVPDSAVYLVGMPPGWHVTTGPGTVLYDPAHQARGRFAVEAEIFLFPGESLEGYGIFLGGSGLDSTDPSWTAFLMTRDGSATIERRGRGGTTVIFPPTPSPAVKPHPGASGTAHNILRVAVEGDSVVVSANGQRVTAIPRGDLPLEGTFGFRVGKDVNLHASNLDLITRLAPLPVRR
jgi:hypothetical protein